MEHIATFGVAVVICIATYFLKSLIFDPIIQYRKVVARVDKNLTYYANAKFLGNPDDLMPGADWSEHNAKVEEGKKVHRKDAGELRAAYNVTPGFYQNWLARKGVDPLAASKDLIRLSNEYKRPDNPKHARHSHIRKHLQLYDLETKRRMSQDSTKPR